MSINVRVLEPRWFLVIAFFVAGIFLGVLGSYLLSTLSLEKNYKIHSAHATYKYINPLLAVDLQQGQKFSENTSLKLEIEGLIAQEQKNNDLTGISIYFRDLDPGAWVAINDNEKFSPGKLLKIPLMISYYKVAESNPDILKKEILFTRSESKDQAVFPVKNPLVPGTTYTIDDLINQMIIYSDDDAANLLFDTIDNKVLNEIFSDLGIDFRENKETEDFISLKLYSLFFRILYNATYLNREYSEKALDLLIKTDSSVGLGSQLPKNLPFANRFGGRPITSTKNGSQGFEIYECGIVYYPSHPYLLCATAEGENLNHLLNFFGTLGKQVYQEITYQYPQSSSKVE